MSTADHQAEHLLMTQDVFGGDRFWTALDRLAQRLGHDEHQRLLRGLPEPTDWYELYCLSCERAIATMTVQRDHQPPDEPGDGRTGP